MIDSIIFDFNGTILDDFDLTYKIEKNIFNSIGFKKFNKKICKDTFTNPINVYYKNLGLDENKYNYNELNSTFFNTYLSKWKEGSYLFKDEKECLLDLKARGFKLYILSATEINLLKEQLEFFKIYNIFDGICAAKNQEGKSKIEFAKEFINQNNLNSSNTILVGDTIHDFECANEFGFDSIFFLKGHNSKKRLSITNKPLVSSYKALEKEIIKRNKTLIDY